MGSMKGIWAEREALAELQLKKYPQRPGWKDPGISRENAERIAESSSERMKRVQQEFEQGFTGTADELAEWMGWSPFTVRPLCTRLRQLNVIERTPERRKGAGGGSAAVLRLKDRAA